MPENLPGSALYVPVHVLHLLLYMYYNRNPPSLLRPGQGSLSRYPPCPEDRSCDRSGSSSDLPESPRLKYFH